MCANVRQRYGKISYLCIVKRNDGIWAQGTKNLLSGLAKFTACPERKKGSPICDNIKH